MDVCDPFLTPQRDRWQNGLQAILEVLLLAGVVSSYLASLPFSLLGIPRDVLLTDPLLIAHFVLLEAGITLVLLFLILNLHQQPLSYLGGPPRRWARNVLLGFGLVPILFLINLTVSLTFLYLLPRYFTDRNPLLETIRTPRDLVLFVFAGLLAGGIKEEFQRAFILTRFREHLGGATLGLVLWSVIFGAAHYIQGPQGMIVAGLFGLLFGAVYIVQKSLVAPIIAHGVYDTVALLGYWFFKDAVR